MENVKTVNINKMLIFSIFGVLAFILAVFGLTYAFFAIQVQGNDSASSIIVNVANLGTVTFYDGAEINAENIYPVEVEERYSKTFEVTATENTVPVDYKINFVVTANTFVNYYEREFTYTMSGTKTGTGVVADSVDTIVPAVGTHTIGIGKLGAYGDTHNYTFTIGLNEVGSNQNSNQGKTFAGKLEIVTDKKYTAGGSIWGE